jgi:trimeric autotransporter adhesin
MKIRNAIFRTTPLSHTRAFAGLVTAGMLLSTMTVRSANAQTIQTVAGNGIGGYSGDNIPATQAELHEPAGVSLDPEGNLLIADAGNEVIREVNRKTGIITTVVGAAFACGSGGDGGLATDALLCSPEGVTADHEGNLYIADTGNQRVRRVDHKTHIITTIAGTGVIGFSGDGGPGNQAQLANPEDIAIDRDDNVYIADGSNFRVRRIDCKTGIITTVVGGGTGGDGSQAVDAEIGLSFGLAFDSSGNLFIADSTENKVHRVDHKTGIITTIAGTGSYGYSGDGGPATQASLSGPFGVAVEGSSDLYIADESNNRVRHVDLHTGLITTYVGNGYSGSTGDLGPAGEAELNAPSGLVLDKHGVLYIGDQGNQRVRRVDPPSFGSAVVLTVKDAQGFFWDGGNSQRGTTDLQIYQYYESNGQNWTFAPIPGGYRICELGICLSDNGGQVVMSKKFDVFQITGSSAVLDVTTGRYIENAANPGNAVYLSTGSTAYPWKFSMTLH